MRRHMLMASALDAVTAQIERFFAPRGFHVDVARGGAECLDKVRHVVSDSTVLDCDLPRTGGAGILEVKANAKVPVVLVSGRFLTEFDLSEPFKSSLHNSDDVGSLFDALDAVLASTDIATGAIITKKAK